MPGLPNFNTTAIRDADIDVLVPAADLSDWDDYEINLDQRVLSPEISMAACMAGRPAGWR
jgi:hypothetical protein